MDEIQEMLIESVERGTVIAFFDGSDIRYKHVEHCDDNEMVARISADELRRILATPEN